jgi:hypothetical protein
MLVAAFAALLILLGGLLWFRPYVTKEGQPVVGVPTPPALFALTEFPVPPGSEACMNNIALEPEMGLALFDLRPARPGPRGGPPVDLVLSAQGYQAKAHVPGGYPGGAVALPVPSPNRSETAVVCFVNRGRSTVLLDGTAEPRTVAARSATVIGGRAVPGDIALTFLATKTRSPIDDLERVFSHASNLTDRLVPVWLVWVLAVLCALGVPLGTVAALYLSLRGTEPARAP